MCRARSGVEPRCLGYDRPEQAAALLEPHRHTVDGWLVADAAADPNLFERHRLNRPAVRVVPGPDTLLEGLVRIAALGRAPDRFSVDTLTAAEVETALGSVGLTAAQVRIQPPRRASTAADTALFHRRHLREDPGSTALTCLRPVRQALESEHPVVELSPSRRVLRAALERLLVETANHAERDAQLAFGLVELSDGDTGLPQEVAALGGQLLALRDGVHQLVTTRGPLAEATDGFASLAMLGRLGVSHRSVRVGFGLGLNAAESESLARRALARARRIGSTAGVLCRRGDLDVVLDAEPVAERTAGEQALPLLAHRVGLSLQTLTRLRQLSRDSGETPLTTRVVAAELRIQQRTARRMLHRLELAGLAQRTGSHQSGVSGRPLTLYRLSL